MDWCAGFTIQPKSARKGFQWGLGLCRVYASRFSGLLAYPSERTGNKIRTKSRLKHVWNLKPHHLDEGNCQGPV